MQIAKAVRAQSHSTGGLAFEIRRTGLRRGQTLDDHHLVRLGILEPNELDVMLLGHYVRYLHINVVPRYGHLGQMLGRIAVAIWLVNFLGDLTLFRARLCAYMCGIIDIRDLDDMHLRQSTGSTENTAITSREPQLTI